MHWGNEEQRTPSDTQVRRHLHLQSLGVDIVIGCHPHVLQGHTLQNSTFTAFSLGDFVFGPTGFKLQVSRRTFVNPC